MLDNSEDFGVGLYVICPSTQSNKVSSSLAGALTKHLLPGNVPLRHLINAKPLFISW